MKKQRLLYSLLMAMVMMAISPQKMWALGGSGTASSPYTIATAADLVAFASKVNGGETGAYAKLTADITLTSAWTSIGNSSKIYTGTFDGQGHKISGLSLTATAANAGLFGYVNGATIKNFTLDGTISSNSNNVGSVAGHSKGNTQILDVVSSVNITMSAAKQHLGGIVGYLCDATGDTPILKGCTYSGTMNVGSSTDSNGGIVGYGLKNANISITNCFFSGTIKTTGSNARVGGILGYADDDGSNFVALSGCFVNGSFSTGSGTDNVGAIVGMPRGNTYKVIKNNNCLSGVATHILGNNFERDGKCDTSNKAITISVTAGTGGKVTPTYVNPTSTTATQLKVVAEATTTGYHFTNWSDNETTASRTEALTADISLTANFDNHYTLKLNRNDYYYGEVTGGGSYTYGEKVTITATPASNCLFLKWSDGNTNATRQVTVTENITITAIFARPKAYLDNGTLTLCCDDKEHQGRSYYVEASPQWSLGDNGNNITAVVFDASFAIVRPTTCYAWFNFCENLRSVTGLQYLNTSEVTEMSLMFNNCTSLTSLDLSSFNTEKVTNMRFMFNNCKSLTSLDLSSFNTQNVTNMNTMFTDCTNLTTLTVNNFTIKNGTSTENMFNGCTRLNTLNLKSLPFMKNGTFNTQFTGTGKTVNLTLGASSVIYSGTNYLPAFTNCNHYQQTTPVQVNATCIKEGYNAMHCSYCKNDFNKTPIVVNHAMTEHAAHDATCTTDGNLLYYTCSRSYCLGKYYKDNGAHTTNTYANLAEIVKPHPGHDFTSETATATYEKSPATCNDDAVYYHKCSRCTDKGTTYWTDEGSALGHDYAVEYTIDVEATCETAGSKSKHCSRCESKDDVQTILALGHDYAAEYTVDVEQTCVIDGVKSKHCSRCESKDDVQIIPASGSHTFAANDPNHTHCTVCNHGFIYYTTTGEDISIYEDSFPELLSRSFDSETKRGTMEFSGPVTTIGTYAFANCGYLKTVTLPQTLQSIEIGAFSGCSSLDGIELPSSIRTIGRSAFFGCSSLDGIELPSSIQTIGERAFHGCASFTSIVIPEGVTSIGERTFAFCTKLESVTLPRSVTSIGEYAFQNCTSLTGISSDYVTTIGTWAFFWCSNLTTVHFPKATSVYAAAFYECNKISEITVSCSKDVGLERVPATATVTRIHLGYTEDVPARAPTCFVHGNVAYTRCGDFLCYNRSGDEFRIPALGHDIMTHHAAVASTCTTQGNEEYWTCSRDCCEGKYYMDESGYGVTRNSLPTLALASHQWGDDHACTECGHEAAIAHTGTCGHCTWTIYEDGFMLVKPTKGESGTLANWNNAARVPWDAYRSEITSVKFQGEVIALSCIHMFSNCSNLTSIDFGDIYTGDVTYMNNMFSGCTALQELDLSNFLTTVNTNFEYMFSDCPNLATLKLSNDFGIKNTDQNSTMFTNCGNSETKCKVYYVNDYSIKATIHNYWGDIAEFVESAIVKDGWRFENYNQQNIPADNVVFTRTFTPEKPATAMLPFWVGANQINGATFYEFKGVKYENGEWVATMQDVSTVQAYKPYVVITSGTGITFTGSQKLTFPITPAASYMTTTDPETGWTFKALNNYKFWNSPSDSELGKAYGFAGKDKTVDGKNVHQGEFVKIAVGASAKPGRCYLVKNDGGPLAAKGMARAAAADELPSRIKVHFINGDSETTGIATLDTETGEMSDVQWYDLNGKKIDTPTKRGIYIKNNKKVMVR